MDKGEIMTFTLSDGTVTTSLTAVQADIKKTLLAKQDFVNQIHIDSEEGQAELTRLFGIEE
jgi:hypothetical protein